MLEVAFWLSALSLFYAFVGYPLLIGVLAFIRSKPVAKEPVDPPVSLIIAAHNEEAVIEDKINNSLALRYPPGRLEIIVASDCSTDRTNHIVSQYANQGVRLLVLPERRGKTAAQELAVTRARGEILVFSDASILLEPDSIWMMVQNFADPSIGCVSCEDRSVDGSGGKTTNEEGLYVRYEMRIRRWESRFGSIVGASGCFYGVRKALWRHGEDHLVVDFTTPLDMTEQGFRSVTEPDAIAYVRTVASPAEEFVRRVRTATRGLRGLLYKRHLLNPLRFGFFSFQLFSHKVLRFLGPLLLALLLVTNISLIPAGVTYQILLALQAAFYASASIGFLLKDQPRTPRIFAFPLYFVLVNYAILVAMFRILHGENDSTWTPSRRAPAYKTR